MFFTTYSRYTRRDAYVIIAVVVPTVVIKDTYIGMCFIPTINVCWSFFFVAIKRSGTTEFAVSTSDIVKKVNAIEWHTITIIKVRYIQLHTYLYKIAVIVDKQHYVR